MQTPAYSDTALHTAVSNGCWGEATLLLSQRKVGKAACSSLLQLAAESGHLEIVRLLLPLSEPKANNSLALCHAARCGHLEVVKLLLPVSDPLAANSLALYCAATKGDLEVVRALLPSSSVYAKDFLVLRTASARGHLEIVRLLLQVAHPVNSQVSHSLQHAVEIGHLEIVKLLLPFFHQAKGCYALQIAAEIGHLEILTLLLPLFDPKENNSAALRLSATNGHLEIVKLLLPLSNVDKVFQHNGFTRTSGCDLLVSCFPPKHARLFMDTHKNLTMPRTRAMLATVSLGSRMVERKALPNARRRA